MFHFITSSLYVNEYWKDCSQGWNVDWWPLPSWVRGCVLATVGFANVAAGHFRWRPCRSKAGNTAVSHQEHGLFNKQKNTNIKNEDRWLGHIPVSLKSGFSTPIFIFGDQSFCTFSPFSTLQFTSSKPYNFLWPPCLRCSPETTVGGESGASHQTWWPWHGRKSPSNKLAPVSNVIGRSEPLNMFSPLQKRTL